MASAIATHPPQHVAAPDEEEVSGTDVMTDPTTLISEPAPESHLLQGDTPHSGSESESESEPDSESEGHPVAESTHTADISEQTMPAAEQEQPHPDSHGPGTHHEETSEPAQPVHLDTVEAGEPSVTVPTAPSVTIQVPHQTDLPTTADDVPTPTTSTAPAPVLIGDADDTAVDHPAASPRPHVSVPADPVSPMTPSDSHRTSIESMTSIALSEAGIEYTNFPANIVEDMQATPRVSGIKHSRKPSSLDIMQNTWTPLQQQGTFFDTAKESILERRMSSYDDDRDLWTRQSITSAPNEFTTERNNSIAESIPTTDPGLSRSSRSSSVVALRRASGESWMGEDAQVDWQALDKTEEQEKEDKDLAGGAEDESTAFLLARLEQENAKFTNDPKSIARTRSQSRPPSMAQIKKLVTNQDAPTIRFSLVPELALPDEPPPMTELEFWAALVQDYPSTAVRLPTLTTTKIRSGIPPPLRGVVWTSMAGARDKDLEESFQRLAGEKSPYEGIINKDVGRSFPGVELFRDAEGEGQRMLGRVLKCFSLHDQDIGYCQGLGFLVGPLLMNMGESEAFCVLVRLMDHYSLRPSFLPSLSGLHMRIYQFTSLLKKHHRTLHDHLSDLGVEPAYLSQWFLSCFAVTCPLPMLFRIYDVIFAEGANETVMRVALALMRRHEDKMLEASEFEEVMQLLLGREIWDCYGGDADLLVDDFTSLGDTVTHARLAELEKEFSAQSSDTVVQSAGFLPDVQAAASRFLGRIWTPGHIHANSKPNTAHTNKASVTTLSPPTGDKEPVSNPMGFFMRQPGFLRRSPSKQSITVVTDGQNGDDTASSSGSGSGSGSYTSTAPTEHDHMGVHIIRESYADTIGSRSKAESIAPTTPSVHTKEQQELHGQIEDLLTALSEMQREQAQMAAMLQREREERSEDHRYMRDLVRKIDKSVKDNRRRTVPAPPRKSVEEDGQPKGRPLSVGGQPDAEPENPEPKDEIQDAVDKVQERLDVNTRFSFNLETKAQLRSILARTREQLGSSEALARDLHGRLEGAEGENDDLRSEVKELRARVNDDFKLRQKMEFQLKELKTKARANERKSTMVRTGSLAEVPTLNRINSGGLRELKLGRRESTSSIQSLRSPRLPPQIQVDSSQAPKAARASVAFDPGTPVIMGCDTPDTVISPLSATTPLDEPLSATTKRNRMSYGRRTTSLATKEVLATPAHEPVPDEALLLELINSKTSEAQARNEVDELKKALSVGKRKQDEAQRQHAQALDSLRAELAAIQADALKSSEAARHAKAESAALKLSTASVASTPIFSLPPTPFLEDGAAPSPSTPALSPPGSEEKASATTPPPKAETVSSVGSWFWGRRTTSKSHIPTVQKEVT